MSQTRMDPLGDTTNSRFGLRNASQTPDSGLSRPSWTCELNLETRHGHSHACLLTQSVDHPPRMRFVKSDPSDRYTR